MKRLTLIGLALCTMLTANAKNAQLTDHIEPTSWWSGMAHTELQLMLHGTDIASAQISVKDNALTILRIEKSSNPNYLFVYLDTKNAAAGTYQISIKKGKKTQTVNYVLNARAEGSAERKGFTSADAWYLLMPDRFANGDPTNDNLAGCNQGVVRGNLYQRQGGDIQGIINHLDHIADCGFTAVWPTPVLTDNDTAFSYHHYAISDYYRIDPRLGTNDDYKRLADECHKRGLKLIKDIVPNHCGRTHWWMNDLPDTTWLHQWPTFTRTNYNVSIWTNDNPSDKDLTLLEKGWFDTNMPDLNLANPLLFDYLRQVYVYWIEFAGIDGLRVDTYPYNDIFVASKLMNALNKEYPNINIVGECWVKSPVQTAFYQTGAKNRNGFDSGLQSVMDFTLKDVFEWSFKENEAWNTGLIRFYNHFAQDFVYPNKNLIMNMLDNHDMDRYAALVDRDPKLYKMGLAVISTIRGYPQLYYGDEIMIEGNAGTYEEARHTFPGGWADDTHNAFDPAQRTALENDIYNYTKSLLTFRKHCPALHDGAMRQFLPVDGIYVYFRYTDNSRVMVIVNNNTADKTVDLDYYNEMQIIGHTAHNVTENSDILLENQITIPAKTIWVFEIK